MFHTYIIRSQRDGQLYVGYTNDMNRRLEEHNAGMNRSTKARRPFEPIYYEAYKSEEDAKLREKNLKLFGRAREGVMRRLKKSLEC